MRAMHVRNQLLQRGAGSTMIVTQGLVPRVKSVDAVINVLLRGWFVFTTGSPLCATNTLPDIPGCIVSILVF